MPIRGGFVGSPATVACFTEPNTTGSIQDINSPRNAPAKNPGAYPHLVQWHSEFFQYELAYPIQTVTITHPALAGQSKFWGPSDQFWINAPTYTSQISYQIKGQTSWTEQALFYHNLGYIPLAFVAYNGNMLMPGVAVQIESEGRTRFVSAYVTESYVGITEVYMSSLSEIPAVSRTYQVLVFSSPAANASLPTFSKDANHVQIGKGKIRSSKQYMKKVAPGDTPFDIDSGPTVDINQGRARIVTGGTVMTEPGYGGGFGGPSYIAVGV